MNAPFLASARENRGVAETVLTPEEIVVIAIGRADARRIGWRGGAGASGWRRLLLAALRCLGCISVAQSLANERLETLRLLVCMAVRRDEQVEATADRLVEFGMTPAAVQEVILRTLA